MKERFIQAAAAAIVLGTVPAAQAVPTINVFLDGGLVFTCADNAGCDNFGALAGAVDVNYSVGDFLINSSTGVTQPIFSGDPLMDLNSINVQTSGGAHTLVVEFVETGFEVDGIISGEFGGTLSGTGATVKAELFVNGVEVGQIGEFGPGAFSGTFSDGAAPAGPYSLSQRVTLTTTGAANFSGDFEVSVVPEPATLALLGVGLGLFGFSMRRRLQAS